MNKYRIVYLCCDNGYEYEGEVIIYAANRIAAFEVFKGFGYENVVNADCYRVLEEEDK